MQLEPIEESELEFEPMELNEGESTLDYIDRLLKESHELMAEFHQWREQMREWMEKDGNDEQGNETRPLAEGER